MPFIRKGKCVFRKNSDGSLTKKGCSSSIKDAKQYMKKLYQISEDEEETFEECYNQFLNKFK